MKTSMVGSIPRPGADPSSPEFQVSFGRLFSEDYGTVIQYEYTYREKKHES